ncbi:MAG: NHL repeat-containing protein [Candidatus Poribacteria bacterium]
MHEQSKALAERNIIRLKIKYSRLNVSFLFPNLQSSIFNLLIVFCLCLSACCQPKPVNIQPFPVASSPIAANHINTIENFYQPAGIAFDYDGNIYVADSGNSKIQLIDKDYRKIVAIGRFGWKVGEFDHPMDVAFSNLMMYIADSGNNRIQRYGLADRIFGVIAGEKSNKSENSLELYSPQGIATDLRGDVYIVDTWDNRILKTDLLGNILLEIGGLNRFNKPQGVMVDKTGNIYVCDTGNNRVCKLDFSGIQTTCWGSEGDGKGQFQTPTSISQDKNGNLYVVDQGNKRIQAFNPDRAYLGEFGQDELKEPYDIAIDNENHAYVTDMSSSNVEVYKIIPPK